MSEHYIDLEPINDEGTRSIPRRERETCQRKALRLTLIAGKAIFHPFAIALGAMSGGWLAFAIVSHSAPLRIDVNLKATLPGPY